MLSLLRHPFAVQALKFLARIAWASVWGILLSPFELEARITFGGLLAILAGVLSVSFYAFDRVAFSASRMALYGLLVAGEAMSVGALVFACLGAFTGQLEGLALVACAFVGTVLTLYSLTILYQDNLKLRDNMSKGAGSNH